MDNRVCWEPEIMALARQYGYHLEQRQPAIGLLIYVKPGIQVNIYTTTMTVATIVHHPTRGVNQLFRRQVTLPFLEQIFDNPRVHTKAQDRAHGYRQRHERACT